MTVAELHLGKLPPKRYAGDIAVRASNFLDLDALRPDLPPTFRWGQDVHYKMYLNNQLPDCTCACYGHGVQTHSMRSGLYEEPTDDDILELFHSTGQEQGLSDSQGRYMEGVLKHLSTAGLRETQKYAQYQKLLGYAAVNWLNHDEVRQAAFIFGGLYIGAALPLSAADQFRDHKSWRYVRENNNPGSWGGHAMWVIAISSHGPVVVTWARRQQMTWGWWDHYVDECYAVVEPAWLQREQAPSGFAKEDLINLLQEING